MKEDRKPVYNQDKNKRVISAPNGQWFVQEQITTRGTRESDNWRTVGKATDFNTVCNRAGVKQQ